jgi:hypothetical protein
MPGIADPFTGQIGGLNTGNIIREWATPIVIPTGWIDSLPLNNMLG